MLKTEELKEDSAHLVIVPSISEMTMWSVESHTNILAVHAATPELESEKVMVFAPGSRLSLSYRHDSANTGNATMSVQNGEDGYPQRH